MELDQFPLAMFEVDCDGSACGSNRSYGRHIHPPQDGGTPLCRVRIVEGERAEYFSLASFRTRLMSCRDWKIPEIRPVR
jgi:hypothetical protein